MQVRPCFCCKGLFYTHCSHFSLNTVPLSNALVQKAGKDYRAALLTVHWLTTVMTTASVQFPMCAPVIQAIRVSAVMSATQTIEKLMVEYVSSAQSATMEECAMKKLHVIAHPIMLEIGAKLVLKDTSDIHVKNYLTLQDPSPLTRLTLGMLT